MNHGKAKTATIMVLANNFFSIHWWMIDLSITPSSISTSPLNKLYTTGSSMLLERFSRSE
jgi:hypothetical protein